MQRFTRQIVFVTTIFFFTGMPTLVLHAQELGAGQTPPAQAQRAANAPALVPVKFECRRQFPNLSTVRDGPGFPWRCGHYHLRKQPMNLVEN